MLDLEDSESMDPVLELYQEKTVKGEFIVVFEDGSKSDKPIHDEILSNREAQEKLALLDYQMAIDNGVDEDVARRLYLPKDRVWD